MRVSLVAASILAIAACGGSGDHHVGTARASSPTAVTSIPFDLYTHCGVDEARIGTDYYEADRPLDDGMGNPPSGWSNPTATGTMTVYSDHSATFHDGLGHVVRFHLRSGAESFKQICS